MGMVFSMASTAKDSLTEIILFNKERRDREEEEREKKEIEVTNILQLFFCNPGNQLMA